MSARVTLHEKKKKERKKRKKRFFPSDRQEDFHADKLSMMLVELWYKGMKFRSEG